MSVQKGKFMVLFPNSLMENLHVSRSSSISSEGSTSNSASYESSPSFCSMSNLQNSVIFLCQELHSLGFRHKIIESNEERLDLIALVNAFWEVIQLYHSAVKDGNILHDSRRRDVADINHLQGSVRDLKSSLEEKDRLILEAQEKERQANSINKALGSKLKSEKEEVKRLGSALQQRELQYQHESKKKEVEMNKLRDKLYRFVAGDRSSECRVSSMTMSSPLDGSDRARGRWRTDNTNIKHEEELFRRVLGQYEAWVGQLSEEVDLLKEFLSTISGKLSKIAVKCANLQIRSVAEEEECLNESLACSVLSSDTNLDEDPLYSLNFINFKPKIQKNIEDNLEIIMKQLEKKDKVVCEHKSKESNGGDLRSEEFCEELRLRFTTDSNLEKNINDVVEGMYAEKISEMEQAMQQVLDMKKNLEQEREIFTAAAVRLNRERANFEAEKVELLKNQFLEELPSFLTSSGNRFTPNTSLESPNRGRSLTDLYGDPPHTTEAVPIFTSPSGDIHHSPHPIVLGPTRMTRTQSKVSRIEGELSDPCSRNSSVNRFVETHFVHEAPRSKTLERPESSIVGPSLLEPSYIEKDYPGRYSTRSLSRIPKLKQKQHYDEQRGRLSASSGALLFHSVNCPPVGEPVTKETNGKSRKEAASVGRIRESIGSHAPLVPVSSLSTEGSNYDSGFSNNFDPEDLDSNDFYISSSSFTVQQKLRDTQTNNRLDAIENSLMNLLEQMNDKETKQVNSKDRLINSSNSTDGLSFPSEEHVKRNEAEIITEKSSGRVFIVKKKKPEVLHDKPRSQSFRSRSSCSNCEPKLRHSTSSISTYATSTQNGHGSPSSSTTTSRKSSRDRKPGENYLKKLQNNFSKWYWKG